MTKAFICSEETDDVLGEVTLSPEEARHVFGCVGAWRASLHLDQDQINTCGIDSDDRVYAVPV